MGSYRNDENVGRRIW